MVSRFIERGQPYALVDFPNYSNVGDSAIWLGASKLLRDLSGRWPSYICEKYGLEPDRMAAVDGPIFILGGGNFGDLWPAHQEFRERLLAEYPNDQIIQLPQSIHFDDEANISRAADAIARHGRFHLMVRDRASLEFAKARLPCPVTLVPDCAVFLKPRRIGRPVHDTVLLMRSDKEKAPYAADLPTGHVCDWLDEPAAPEPKQRPAVLAKVLGGAWAASDHFNQIAKQRLARGITRLSSGREVYTDRLHGHILASLLGIPNTALDNSYGKISGYHRQWMRDLPGAQLADSLDPEVACGGSHVDRRIGRHRHEDFEIVASHYRYRAGA
jgi:exopolysaccharide biosynthesis predicted pyruvyltransferase EpsI